MEKQRNKKLFKLWLSAIITIPLVNCYLKLIGNNINAKLGIGTSIVIWMVLVLIFVLLKNTILTTKANAKIEVEGINLKNKDGTYGTADWATKEEIKEFLSIGKNDGIIIGETDDHEIITLPMDTYLNKNIAVFGSSGSKKSRGFAIPNAIELAQEELQEKIKRKMSLVFTDPKGELYRKLTKYLETKGYDVKVFNLVNPIYSNAANFIKFVEDETDAQIFSQIVIEETQLARKSGGDEFWNRGEQNLLKALLLYVINYVEKEEDRSIGFIYDVLETVKNGFANFDFAMVIAESKNDLENGKISVGCPSHITNFFLMDKIAEAIRDYPNMQVDLDTESDSKQLMELLKNNKIDFAILDVIPEEYLEDLEIKEIKDIDNIFVSKEEIVINNIKELENYKYILAQDNKISTRKLLEEMKKYDLKIRPILKCPTTEQRVNAAKHGIGVAYVMREAVKEEIEKKELYEMKIPIDLPKNSLKIVYLKNHLTKVDKEFIKRYLK